MTTPTIAEIYKFGQLATASYVRMGDQPEPLRTDGATFAQQANAQVGGRLPRSLGTALFNPASSSDPRWNILSYYGADAPEFAQDKSGFAGTLFQNSATGEKVLALRGTEPSEDRLLGLPGTGVDLLSADLGQIGIFGLALTQVVSMANYVMRLRAAAGELVPQLKVEAAFEQPASQPFVRMQGTADFSDIYLVFESLTWATGLGKLGPGDVVTLTGQSLGGHLAAMAARLFPDIFDQTVVVFNAAGYDPTMANTLDLFTRLGSNFGIVGGLITQSLKTAIASELGPAANFLETYANQRSTSALDKINEALARSGISQGVPTVASVVTEDIRPGDDTSLVASRWSGADRYGTPIQIPSEANSHAPEVFLDSLALQDLLYSVDNALSLANATRILEASSNYLSESDERLTEALYRLLLKGEKFLDPNTGQRSLEGLPDSDAVGPIDNLLWTGKGVIGARDAFYDAVLSLKKALETAPGPMTVSSLADMLASELRNRGQTVNGLAYRYALKALNPFAILGPDSLYAAHNPRSDLNIADGPLDVYDAATRRGGLTTEYLTDRSEFLAVKNAANVIDAASVIMSSQADNWRYVDLAQNYEVTAFGTAPASIRRYAVFGGDGADRLEGSSQADRLYGGVGTDYVIGHGGNDYQEGGTGLDLYRFNTGQRLTFSGLVFENDGADEIRDIDGLGLLRYVYTPLLGSAESAVIVDTSVRINDTSWQSADGKFTYTKQGADLLVTINVNGGGSLALRDFREGDFGIYLWTGRADPTTARTLEGDRKPEDADPNLAGDQLAYDNWSNVVTTSEVAQDRDDGLFGHDDDIGDLIVAGGGNDILLGDTPMMPVPGPRTGFDPLQSGGGDWLQGDSGRDFIDGGPGNDLVEGGFGGVAGSDAGGDVIQGGLGDDSLYGDFRSETGAAIRDGETDAASTLKGDFISGGAGQDWLIGSAAKDVLMGGGGKDVLVGGAGDDIIRGDDGQGATTLAWNVTRTRPVANGPNVYDLDFTGTNFFDFSEGGADVIYGGAGEDWVFAEVGDDFVDGGSGDDVLFGGFGSDIVLGGAGNDVIVGDEGGAADTAEGGDYLDGGDGADTIFGNAGDDIIVGGRGDDTLVGGAGKDVYVYEKGDGRDRIDDSDTAGSATSVIHFGPGLARQDVKFGVGSLKISFGNDDELHVEGFDQLNPSNTPLISELRFDDGQVMTFADILAQGFDIDGTSAADLITGTGVVDRIRGLEGNDVLVGLDGDDFLYGGSGSDILQGGAGNDYLEGGDGFDTLNGEAGDDSYVYDTFDTINDSQGLNRIVFGEGIAPEDLSVNSFVVSGQPRLLIARPGSVGAGLEIRGASLTSSNFVYSFGDGRTLSQTELLQMAYFVPQFITGTTGNDSLTGFAGNDSISGVGGNDTISGGGGNDLLNGGENDDTLLGGAGNDQLSGFTGNDTLSGGAGADWLSGGDGADSYLFGYGDGHDTVSELGADGGVDTVRLADGISLSDVTLTHQPNDDLAITLNATQERLTLSGWYALGPRVEQIVFGDGTVIGESALAAISVAPISGTAGNDILGGTRYEDTLQGLAGDDVLDGGPNTAPYGYVQSNDLLLGGEGHDTYVLGWRNARDTVVEQAAEASTIRLAPAMTFDDVVARREGDDLFVHGRRTEHGLLLKNYYTQAHDWHIETALGSSMSMPEFLARPAPTTGDPVRDLWEARKTQFKHEWYGVNRGELQANGSFYQAPSSTLGLFFGRTYDNGDWASGTGGLQTVPFVAGEGTTSFGAGTDISSDAASQFYRLSNESGTTTRTPATYAMDWSPPSISRTTTYLGTYVGFDLLIHSLYRTHASVTLSGAVQGITLNAANGASGPDIVAAVMSGSLPGTVNGFFDSSTSSFNPVEIHGGVSSNAIALVDFGMVDGGAGNDVIDSVGGGWFSHPAGGNFLYGGTGNDGITGSGDGDLISGGPGNDTLAGWSGDDTFYFFAADSGVDIVNEATWYLWDTYDGLTGRSLYNADSGRDSEDTVEFGDGISLDGLTLSWGTYDSRYAWWSPLPLKTYDTLDIYWGTGKGVRVMMPDRFDADVRKDMTIYSPGKSWGIEHFKFADGTTVSLQQMADRIPTQVLNGTAGDDFLEGGAGNNEFFGGSGFDYLYGAFGLDVYHFNLGDGEDWIRDPGGNDRVVFGEGITPDMLSLGMGSMLVRVGSGGDALHIEYFDPNDALRIGAVETYEFADGTTLTHAQLLERGFDFVGSDVPQTLNGTSVTDRMYGLGGNDTLFGGAGNDLLDGGLGDDTLNGGLDADNLAGGEGNDTYVVDNVADVVIEAPGEGADSVQSSISYSLSDNIENLTLTGTESIDGIGNALDNVITGNSGANWLSGLDGNDTLSGGAGGDVMLGGRGDDNYIVDNVSDVVLEQADEGTDLVQSSLTYTLGANVENLILTGSSAINGIGNDLANVITGNANGNMLNGLGGNDTMFGGNGNDTLDGGVDADSMSGGQGNDTYVVDNLADLVTESANQGTDLVQSSINYTLTTDVENLTLIGVADINGTGNNLNNIITGNSGVNVLSGLAGDDVYVVQNTADVIVENANEGTDLVQSSVTHTLADNVENLTLTGAANISGMGNALNNVLIGNSGANVLSGMAGDDTYIVNSLADVVIENAGQGRDLVQASFTYTLGANLEDLTLTGFFFPINGTGNALDNVITGNSANNVLSGLGGNDTLVGGSGNDTLDGGLGADSMTGGFGNDIFVVDNAGDVVTELASNGIDLVQSSITYTLTANVENLTLTGAENIDGMGNTLNNTITGNSGNNVLDGGAGSDNLNGGAGDDTYVIDTSADVVNDISGTDTVQSSITYTLGSGIENLTLTGAANTNGTGNSLSNVITGNSGDNILDGLQGDDTLMGGEGSDSYRFGIGTGLDTVEELDTQGNDTDTLILGTGITTTNLLGARSGQDLVLTISGASGQLTIKNWYVAPVYLIERAQFSDGTIWDAAALQALAGPSNSAPVLFVPIADLAANEDAQYLFTLPGNTFSDPDLGDTLTYTAVRADGTALPGWLAFDSTTRTFSGTPAQVDVGSIDVRVTVTDSQGLSVDDVFTLSVANTNDAPTVANPIADQAATEDAPFSFALAADAFADQDPGDTLTLSAVRSDDSPLPTWLQFNEATSTFSGTPANGDVGTLEVRVTAMDAAGALVSDLFDINVANVNDAPVLEKAIADQAATEDQAFQFVVPPGTFVDVDAGDTLTLSATLDGGTPLPTWLEFDASTRTFSGTPANEDVGTLRVQVTATDGSAASVLDIFGITVANVNDAPVVANPVADQTATEDSQFSFTVPVSAIVDPDVGDVLTWNASDANGEALPGWLTFDTLNRVFSGTPTNDDVGSFRVRVTATDGSSASAFVIFDVAVANTNDAPLVAQPIVDKFATEDQLFALTVWSGTFADVDVGDALTLSASLADDSALPAWLTLNGSLLSGTPLNADVREYEVKLIATDTSGATATDVFHLDVANVNDTPVVASPLDDLSFEANTTFTFTVAAGSFVDEDAGDTLAYSASLSGGGALLSWLTFNAATATFAGSPVTEDIGISHIAVTATDASGASAVSDFGLIVRAPADSTVAGDDGDDVIYGWTGDETLVGQGGDDALFGNTGDDLLRGGTGIDVLQGEAGSDVLRGGTDNNVLDGGSGDDLIFDGSGDSFISGGAGNDTIRMATGNDVIAFNSGDGWDTIIGGGDGGNTLSFGGGIRYSDLSFSKLGDDLMVNTGQNEGLVLNDWYAGSRSVLNLQIVLDATAEFDAGSTDPLYNRRVQTFSFLGLVSAFDQARMASPGLTSWDVTNALLQWHLWGADDAALGGDLAYWYGKNRALGGISLAAAQQVIGAAGFGSDAQSLRPFSGIQEGFVKLS